MFAFELVSEEGQNFQSLRASTNLIHSPQWLFQIRLFHVQNTSLASMLDRQMTLNVSTECQTCNII